MTTLSLRLPESLHKGVQAARTQRIWRRWHRCLMRSLWKKTESRACLDIATPMC